LFFLSSAVKKYVFKYFSEADGFRVEDQGLSFLYGGKLGSFYRVYYGDAVPAEQLHCNHPVGVEKDPENTS
jgi:hypothetical protein